MKTEVVRSPEEVDAMLEAMHKAAADLPEGYEEDADQIAHDTFELTLWKDREIMPFDDESEVRRWLLGHRGQLLEATYLG